MNEYLYYAFEELKRVDHLIYVSLKYTRTGDVLKSIINRHVQAYEFVVDALLWQLKEDEKIDEIPKLPGVKINKLKEHYTDDKLLNEMFDFYIFLRKANLSDFTSIQEFRRNVTMTLTVEDEPLDVTIDTVTEYYKQTRDYMDYVREDVLKL